MRIMKDSHEAWIGHIPYEWDLTTIGDIYKERSVKVSDLDYPALSVTMNGVVPQLDSVAKSDDRFNRKLVRKGDFVINSRSDRRGAYGVASQDGSCSLINIVLQSKSCDVDYYNYVFFTKSFPEEFYKMGNGIVADLWTTRWDKMRHIKLPNPPIGEQKRISKYLDKKCEEIEKLITLIDASIKEYKTVKNALILKIVLEGINDSHPQKVHRNDWLQLVPADWKIGRIADLFREISEPGEEDLPILTVSINTGVSDRELSEDEQDRAFVRSEDRTKYKRVYPGCITYNMMRAWQGAIGTVRVDGLVSPAYVVARPISNVDSRYIGYLISTKPAIEEMRRYSYGVADFRLRLYWRYFKNMSVCLPPLEEQVMIADYLDEKIVAIDSLIREKEQLLTELKNYKKALIYEYVTGKKEVPQS
ncbi:hypothetical protein [Ruminococcus sp. 5_1_39BFAA]|uniref:hypothetical protein n=1 Tax=Ruminococcus sp. 5_1_39BFAA TaxID=457412 RepID=UPI003562F3EC